MTGPFTKEDFGDKLINDYLKFFDSFSIKNEMYGRIAFHVLLGQALKNVYYMIGKRKIDIRVHLLLIKPQGSGKGAGYGVIQDIAKSLGLEFKSLTESTDAGLIGTLEYDDVLKEKVVVPGLLQSADIVGMEEASVLFDLTSDFSKKNMTYMQITMNALNDGSCFLSKKLGSELIEFKPHASFLLMTYPPDKLAEKIMKTGFFDRVIPVFEEVTLIDRLWIIKKMSEKINTSSTKDYQKEYNDVVGRMEVLVKKYQKEEICVSIPKSVKTSLSQVIEEFAMMVLDASPKARNKLEHFVSRLYETLLKLAVHHALISLRTTLDVGDILYARLIYLRVWKNLIISLESLLIISPIERARHHQIIRQSLNEYDKQMKIKKYVKQKVWVRRLTMIESLQTKWDNCTKETADNSLRKLEKTKGDECEGVFKRVAEYEKDKYFERKNIGGIAYLKKIKDIK